MNKAFFFLLILRAVHPFTSSVKGSWGVTWRLEPFGKESIFFPGIQKKSPSVLPMSTTSFRKRVDFFGITRSRNTSLKSSMAAEYSEIPTLNHCKKNRPSNVKMVHTLQDYDVTVRNEQDKIIVVNFFAAWCKKCQKIKPHFYRLAKKYPQVCFVEVAVSQQNVDMQIDISLKAVPYAHIYHQGSLAEHFPIVRDQYNFFEQLMATYI